MSQELMDVALNENARDSKLGVILALMKLMETRKTKFHIDKDISFGAGLPDHNISPLVRKAIMEAAKLHVAPYAKYDPKSPFFESTISPLVADFHKAHFQTAFDGDKEVKISAGSTPVLTCLAAVTQHPESHTKSGTLIPGTKTLVISPDYPVFKESVETSGGTIDRTARLITKLDVSPNGEPIQDGRWHLDYDSVRAALHNNRDTATLMYLNFPSNPTGYAPTKEEYQKLAELLMEDIHKRKASGITHKMTILEDIAYSTMMHEGGKYYSLHNAIEDLRSETAPSNSERLTLLDELENSVVVSHSFSKAFAVAGHRVGYFASKNQSLVSAVYNMMRIFDLTPSITTLAAMKGAMDQGDVEEKSMKEYGVRLRALEEGLNKITAKWIGGDETNKKNQKLDEQGFVDFVDKNNPVQAKADAGFFSSTVFNFLHGKRVSPEIINSLNSQIAAMADATFKREFEGIFKDGKINNARDAALWLLESANVLAIPMAPQGPDDTNIRLRFSVGGTKKPQIKTALSSMEAALHTIEAPKYVSAAMGR